MKDIFFKQLIKFLCLLLFALNVFSGGNESDSILLETLDEVLVEEYKPCSDQSDINSLEVNTISSLMIVSEGSIFIEGEVITSSSGVQAIVDSYDVETQKLTYHQDASTGFETFLLNETIIGSSSELATVKEFIIDLSIPCSELIVSIEEEPQQMIFIPIKSAEELMEALAIEQEIAAFEAKLAADLASDTLDRELTEFEAQLEEELSNQAALAKFLAKLAEERAAAEASTAAYQAKVAYDDRVAQIKEDLVRQLEEVVEPDDYKSHLVEELIEQATAKLEEEKFIGAISGEIVTVAIHEFCKDNLNLSDSNIALFKNALAGGYLGNVGPQVDYGTEFTANRWDKYITCVGLLGN